jgi:putative sporulation protein YtaF
MIEDTEVIDVFGWLPLILISIAVSLDGFSVGFTYGLQKMRIPFGSLCLIVFVSFLSVFTSMKMGGFLLAWFTPAISQHVGGAILILIGVFTLLRMRFSHHQQPEVKAQPAHDQTHTISRIHLFGIIIQIWRDPSYADTDRSGHIVGWEAVMLSLALSLDALGAGVSLSLFKYEPFVASAWVTLTSVALFLAGTAIGRRFEHRKWGYNLTWIPPVLLICIGLVKELFS